MLTNYMRATSVEERPQLLWKRNGITEDLDRQFLKTDLERAVMLGNLYDESTIIEYEDNWGAKKRIDELVVAATELYVILRGGKTIPIERISRVVT